MPRKRRINTKGRRDFAQPFVMLPHWAFDSPAYRSLKPGPRAILWELVRRYNGANNGQIGFSQRDMAAAINVADRETVAGYVRELEAKGFIKAMCRGSFNVKVADRRATEWALTWQRIGESPPTKEFMHWQPSEIDGTEKPATRDGKSVPECSSIVRRRSNGREIPSRESRRPIIVGTG